VIEEISKTHPEVVRGIRLRRNFGKATAINVGVTATKGEIVFLMDADLQDNPSEIPKFLAKIDEGVDLVVGWKVDRQDPWHKTLPSQVFNYMTSRLTSLPLHDINCGFKCFRAEVFETISLQGEMHRFIPVLANDLGFTVAEVPVDHRARQFGTSKYGIERFLRGAIDLLTVVFMGRYSSKPAHIFGTLAVFTGVIGVCTLAYLASIWFLGETIGHRPLLLFGIMMTLASLQFSSIGLLSELIIRQASPVRDWEFVITSKTRLSADQSTDDKAKG
jgi:glycosyltransferase involved in cell wall biosynthesis